MYEALRIGYFHLIRPSGTFDPQGLHPQGEGKAGFTHFTVQAKGMNTSPNFSMA